MFYLCQIFIIMKFIISESKKDDAVTKWLDRKYSNLTPIKDTIYTTYNNESGNKMFVYSHDDVTIENDNLQYDLFNMFNLSRYDLNRIIKPWIEKTYDINIDMVQYTTWHCNLCGKFHPVKHHIEE